MHVQLNAGNNGGGADVTLGILPSANGRRFVNVWHHELSPAQRIRTQGQHAAVDLVSVRADLEHTIRGSDTMLPTEQQDDPTDNDEWKSDEPDTETDNPLDNSTNHYAFTPNRAILTKYSMGPRTIKVVETQARNENYLLRDPETGRFVKSFLRRDTLSMLHKFDEKLKTELDITKHTAVVSFKFNEVFSEQQVQNTIGQLLTALQLPADVAARLATNTQKTVHPGIRPFTERAVTTATTVTKDQMAWKGVAGAHAGINVLDADVLDVKNYLGMSAKINAQVSLLTGYARIKGKIETNQERNTSWEVSAGLGGFVVAANISSTIGPICISTMCGQLEHNIMIGKGFALEAGVGCESSSCFINGGMGPISNQFKFKVVPPN